MASGNASTGKQTGNRCGQGLSGDKPLLDSGAKIFSGGIDGQLSFVKDSDPIGQPFHVTHGVGREEDRGPGVG